MLDNSNPTEDEPAESYSDFKTKTENSPQNKIRSTTNRPTIPKAFKLDASLEKAIKEKLAHQYQQNNTGKKYSKPPMKPANTEINKTTTGRTTIASTTVSTTSNMKIGGTFKTRTPQAVQSRRKKTHITSTVQRVPNTTRKKYETASPVAPVVKDPVAPRTSRAKGENYFSKLGPSWKSRTRIEAPSTDNPE